MPRPRHATRDKGSSQGLHEVRLAHNTFLQEHHSHNGAANHLGHPLVESHFPCRPLQSQEITGSKGEQNPLKALWEQRPAWLKPIHCGQDGDRSLQERAVNVLTSIPFIFLGLQIPRKQFAARLYGGSLCGVGVASTLYHVSCGEARKMFRYGDYAMIAASTLCLSGAVRRDNSTAFMVASAILLPFSPFVVSVVHTSLMEATFAQRAKSEPALRKAHGLHTLSSIIGGGLFVADDIFPNTPYIHAAWHLAAALGVATSAALVR